SLVCRIIHVGRILNDNHCGLPDSAGPFARHGPLTASPHSSAAPPNCGCLLGAARGRRPPKRTLRAGPTPVRRSAPDCPGSVAPRLPRPPSRFVPSSLPGSLPLLLPSACFPYTTRAIL